MSQVPNSQLPPVSAEYLTKVEKALPGAAAEQSALKFFRSADGKTRNDFGKTSVINNPVAKQTIVLDHIAKEARIIPMSAAAPAAPATPHLNVPTVPGAPAGKLSVKDLGKTFLADGHEVEGKQYTYHLPEAPKAPAAPKTPELPKAAALPKVPDLAKMAGLPKTPDLAKMAGLPKVPGMPTAPAAAAAAPAAQVPAAPAAPQAPKLPQVPHVAEVWTSTKLRMPMLTKVTGSFGQHSMACKSVIPGEPHPSLFQIPAGYKLV